VRSGKARENAVRESEDTRSNARQPPVMQQTYFIPSQCIILVTAGVRAAEITVELTRAGFLGYVL
jgi:hypothetical protein